MEQLATQLERVPRTLPTLLLSNEKESIFDFEIEDIQLEDYDPHPSANRCLNKLKEEVHDITYCCTRS